MITTWWTFQNKIGLTALTILSKSLLAEKTPSFVIRSEQASDIWSQNTIKFNHNMVTKNFFLNQDQGTLGQKLMDLEISGPQNEVVQWTQWFRWSMSCWLFSAKPAKFCIFLFMLMFESSFFIVFVYRMKTSQESADLQDSSGGAPYYRFHLINLSKHFLQTRAL